MEFEPVEFLQGLMSTILILLSIVVALSILLKYVKHKKRELLLVGFAWIGIVSPWIPDMVTFFLVLATGEKLPLMLVFLIGYVPIYFYVMCWTLAFTDFLFSDDNKKRFILFIAIFFAVTEVIMIIFLFTDISLLATQLGPFQLRFNAFMVIFLLGLISYILITGILFARKALLSDNPEINLKGKFLLIAFIFFGIGSIVEASFHITPAIILLTKSVLIVSSITFYIGFIMPDVIKNRFLN